MHWFIIVFPFQSGRIRVDEEIDETEGKTSEEIDEMIKEREAKANAQILEMVWESMTLLYL